MNDTSEDEVVRLATWIRDGLTYPDQRLDDAFEVYASALDIARKIIGQRDRAALPAALRSVPSPEPLDVERLSRAIASLGSSDGRYLGSSERARLIVDADARLAAPQPVPEYPPILATNKTTSGWGPAAPQPIPVDPEAAGDYPSDGPYAPNGPDEPQSVPEDET